MAYARYGGGRGRRTYRRTYRRRATGRGFGRRRTTVRRVRRFRRFYTDSSPSQTHKRKRNAKLAKPSPKQARFIEQERPNTGVVSPAALQNLRQSLAPPSVAMIPNRPNLPELTLGQLGRPTESGDPLVLQYEQAKMMAIGPFGPPINGTPSLREQPEWWPTEQAWLSRSLYKAEGLVGKAIYITQYDMPQTEVAKSAMFKSAKNKPHEPRLAIIDWDTDPLATGRWLYANTPQGRLMRSGRHKKEKNKYADMMTSAAKAGGALYSMGAGPLGMALGMAGSAGANYMGADINPLFQQPLQYPREPEQTVPGPKIADVRPQPYEGPIPPGKKGTQGEQMHQAFLNWQNNLQNVGPNGPVDPGSAPEDHTLNSDRTFNELMETFDEDPFMDPKDTNKTVPPTKTRTQKDDMIGPKSDGIHISTKKRRYDNDFPEPDDIDKRQQLFHLPTIPGEDDIETLEREHYGLYAPRHRDLRKRTLPMIRNFNKKTLKPVYHNVTPMEAKLKLKANKQRKQEMQVLNTQRAKRAAGEHIKSEYKRTTRESAKAKLPSIAREYVNWAHTEADRRLNHRYTMAAVRNVGKVKRNAARMKRRAAARKIQRTYKSYKNKPEEQLATQTMPNVRAPRPVKDEAYWLKQLAIHREKYPEHGLTASQKATRLHILTQLRNAKGKRKNLR